MTLRSELEACISIAGQYKEHEEPFLLVELQEHAQELFLDHGPALLEAVRDAERYRYLEERVFYVPDRFRCLRLEDLAVNLRGKEGQSGGDLLTECIDAARGDA